MAGSNVIAHSILLYQQYKFAKACVRCVHQLWTQLSALRHIDIHTDWIQTVQRRRAKLQRLMPHLSTTDASVEAPHPLLTLVRDRELLHLNILISECLGAKFEPERSKVMSLLAHLSLESFIVESSTTQSRLWDRHQRLCSMIEEYTLELPPRFTSATFASRVESRQTRAIEFKGRNYCDVDTQNIICRTRKRRRKATQAYTP